MKTELLMLNDLVRYKGRVDRVILNWLDGIVLEKNGLVRDNIEPIPLDAKAIFSLFGFELLAQNEYKVSYIKSTSEKCMHLVYNRDDTYYLAYRGTIIQGIRYIHEVQRALRTIGFDGLANNIKTDEV